MKMLVNSVLFAAGVCCSAALAEPSPKIVFDRMIYDFGNTSKVEVVTGVFKFKNSGDAVLKVQPPKPSCGCTIAGLKPDTLKPGESGELSFTLNLGRYRANLEKHIAVKSNDPKSPELNLTIKADYTPLYDIAPMALAPNLPLGVDVTNVITTVTRTDGKPLRLGKLAPTKPWITAKFLPGMKSTDSSARIEIAIRRDGPPKRFNEQVQVYAAGETNGPVSSIFLFGQMLGEISLSPEFLFWNITDPAKVKAEHPADLITRRLTIRSANGSAFVLKNPKSTVAGLDFELVPKESGREYELVAKLTDVPPSTAVGNVVMESSVVGQPKVEVPITVNVLRP